MDVDVAKTNRSGVMSIHVAVTFMLRTSARDLLKAVEQSENS